MYVCMSCVTPQLFQHTVIMCVIAGPGSLYDCSLGGWVGVVCSRKAGSCGCGSCAVDS